MKMSKKQMTTPMPAPVDEVHEDPQPHEVEDAVRTITKAHSIMGDKKMMGHVHKHMNNQMNSLKALKALGNQKAAEESES